MLSFFFFFNDTATTEIYTLSLHDALPISTFCSSGTTATRKWRWHVSSPSRLRSEEHTSELQSRSDLVCRLLLEKKKKTRVTHRRRDIGRTHIQPPLLCEMSPHGRTCEPHS